MDEALQGNTILVACKDATDPFVGTLVHHFQSKSYFVKTATTETAVMALAADPDTALVLIDSSFPDGAAISGRIRGRNTAVPILRCLGSGAAKREAGSFRITADAEIVEPCELLAVFSAAKHLLREGAARLKAAQGTIRFAFPRDSRAADDAFEAFARAVGKLSLSDGAQIELCTAVRETVGAVIRSAPAHKQAATGNDARSQLRMEVTTRPDAVVVTVSAPDGTHPWASGGANAKADQDREYSLGVIRRCVDEAEMVGGGNAIRLKKRQRPG